MNAAESILYLYATTPFQDEERVWQQCRECGCVIINNRTYLNAWGEVEIGHCGCATHATFGRPHGQNKNKMDFSKDYTPLRETLLGTVYRHEDKPVQRC